MMLEKIQLLAAISFWGIIKTRILIKTKYEKLLSIIQNTCFCACMACLATVTVQLGKSIFKQMNKFSSRITESRSRRSFPCHARTLHRVGAWFLCALKIAESCITWGTELNVYVSLLLLCGTRE